MALTQEHMFAVSAAIGGVPVPGLFDSFDGGEISADGAETYNAGGMAEPEALPGVPKTGDVTIGRGYRGERDAPLKKWLNGMINQPMVVGKQALNPDKTPVPGGLETYRGIFTGATTPTHDSNGTSVTKFELTMTVAGLPT